MRKCEACGQSVREVGLPDQIVFGGLVIFAAIGIVLTASLTVLGLYEAVDLLDGEPKAEVSK